jgi:hypothetical protein
MRVEDDGSIESVFHPVLTVKTRNTGRRRRRLQPAMRSLAPLSQIVENKAYQGQRRVGMLTLLWPAYFAGSQNTKLKRQPCFAGQFALCKMLY